MPIYGTCDVCNFETIDYCCPNCDRSEIESLKEQLDATRAERDAAVRERDLLAGLLEQENHRPDEMVYVCGMKLVRRWRGGRVWVTDGGGVYDTALDAIRAAMNNTTT